jgi:hypothetical protein
MMKRLGVLAALAAVMLLAPAAFADKKEVKPTKEFSGSVDDQALQKEAPAVITSAKGLEKLWKAWKVADKMPEVDFTKNLVVTTTSVGSQLKLIASLDTDKGDLTVGGLGTKDLRPGFRYVIGVVPLEGVKTVNGKELPKE